NLERLGALFAQLGDLEPHPNVLALPETALTGYFLEGGVREEAMTAGALARELDTTYRSAIRSPRSIDVTLGFYEIWNNKLYNSAMYVTLGDGAPQVHHVHRKVFLPTYGLFDEERFVERGRDIRAFDTSWGRAALLVCEDAWHSLTGTIAALDGAQLIFLLAAPPARGPWLQENGTPGPASVNRWERLARDIAEEHGVFVALANLVGSEGGKMFPGASMVMGPKGDVRRSTSDVRVVSAGAFVPPLPLDIDPKLTEEWLVHFIKHEMTQRGFTKALVGVSGGVDSAVTAYLAARALGPRNVIGVRMPYRTSHSDSFDHGQLVIDALGIESCTVDISNAVDGYLQGDPNAEPGRRGNVMARMRMIVLVDLSAKRQAIPLGTGNKTERLFGYFTWHADDAPPINPLGDLFKTQVWTLARHL